MTEFFVTYGIISIAYFACLVVIFLKGIAALTPPKKTTIVFGLLIVILSVRMVFDLITEGLWLYITVLFAVYTYLVKKNEVLCD
jgi:O-antigen ligase